MDTLNKDETMIPAPVRKQIHRLKRTLFWGIFLAQGISCLIWLALIAGCGVTAIRSALPGFADQVHWAWLALPVSLLAALLMALAKQPSPARLLVLSDKLGNGGGLLLAIQETGDRTWASKLPDEMHRFPMPRIRPTKSMIPALAALLFLGGSFLLPQKKAEAGTSSQFLAREINQALSDQFTAAKTGMAEQDQQELDKAIEMLREETEKKVDAASLEAADQLSRRLAENLIKREAQVNKALNTFNRTASQLKNMEKPNNPSTGATAEAAEASEQAMQSLASMAQALDNQGIKLKLTPEAQNLLAKLCRGAKGKLNMQQNRELAEQLAKACKDMKLSLKTAQARVARLCQSTSQLGYGDKAYKLLKECSGEDGKGDGQGQSGAG